MNTLPLSFPETLGRALGWMVLHSLWQATLIGIAAAVLLLIFRHRPAYVRYWIANGALAAVLIGALCTLYYCAQEPSTNLFPAQVEMASSSLESVQESVAYLDYHVDDQYSNLGVPHFSEHSPSLDMEISHAQPPDLSLNPHRKNSLSNTASIRTYFERHLPLIVTLWFLGMGLFLLRLLGNVGYMHYLKTRLNFPAEAYWVELLDNLNRRAGSSKTIRLVESALVRTPMVAGYLKPVVLFPIGMINRLETREVEAILAHELAHIIRRDYLFNILQSAVETLFYYHPAIWWLSARVRHEREMAADDIAIALTGNAVEYAKALVTVQDMAFFPLSPSLAFAGTRKSHLLIRVQHILNIKQPKNLAMEKLIGTCAILLVLFGLSYAQNTSSPGNSPQSAPSTHLNDVYSGIWEGKIENDRVCMTLSSRSENSMWMNNECFAKTEFSALPQQEGEFTLARAAGTMTFKGKFEGNEGYGRFTFRADDSFRDWLKQQGVTGINDGILVHLFLANCDKDYVAFLKQKGYDPISGEDLQNMAIHKVDKKTIEDYSAITTQLGERKPSLETMVTMKIHDIDKDFMQSMQQAGFSDLSTEDIVSAKIHGLTPEYLRQCRDMGYKSLDFDDVLNFKIHEVNPEYLNELKKAGLKEIKAEDALNMKIHEVSPSTIEDLKQLGFTALSPEDILNLKIHEVNPAFISDMRQAGFMGLSVENAMNLKIHEISAAFVSDMRQAGFTELSVEDALNLKIHEVSPEFVQQLKDAGFSVSLEEALNFKIHEVSSEFIRSVKDLGFKQVTIDQAVNLKIHEVTPAFIQKMRDKGFKDLDLDEYIQLKIQYGDKIK